MLTRILLYFEDSNLRSGYLAEKQRFYSKALPIISAMLFVVSLTIELAYRVVDLGNCISMTTSLVNWGMLLGFMVASVLIRYSVWVSWLVQPSLTVLSYYYFALHKEMNLSVEENCLLNEKNLDHGFEQQR